MNSLRSVQRTRRELFEAIILPEKFDDSGEFSAQRTSSVFLRVTQIQKNESSVRNR